MKPRIVSIGEVLWDLFPQGAVLGGAAANFALHARAFGGDARLISRVGNDSLGFQVIQDFRKSGFPTEFIAVDPLAETGVVSVDLGADGQPMYRIAPNVAWDQMVVERAALEEVERADAVCFGSLAQRSPVSRETIRTLVGVSRTEALRVFDINLRQDYFSREVIEASLELANVLKLNDGELPVLAELFNLKGVPAVQLAELARRFELRGVVYTRGAHGSLLWVDGVLDEHSGISTEVRDTVGAGDSFTAAVVMGLLNGMPLPEVHQTANEVAAFVCSQSGATPALPENLLHRFHNFPIQQLFR
ncbi:MAG: carbohydrate kinase [Verrucomicrobiota bacterium]